MNNPFLKANNPKKGSNKSEKIISSRWNSLKDSSENETHFKNEKKNKFIKSTETNNDFYKKDSSFKRYSGFKRASCFNRDTGFNRDAGFNKFINYVDETEKEEPVKEFNLQDQDDDFPALC
tara:strand:+ start:118 stop:480 length:363 start_codon:yes stop_codon:yes gene_type:complete